MTESLQENPRTFHRKCRKTRRKCESRRSGVEKARNFKEYGEAQEREKKREIKLNFMKV